MGMMVAVDAAAKGDIKKEQIKWSVYGWQGGFSSPVIDGDRLYQLDNGANIAAFDVTAASSSGYKTSARSRKRRPCSLTANFTSARKTESSSY